jgi:hypothetical protein
MLTRGNVASLGQGTDLGGQEDDEVTLKGDD